MSESKSHEALVGGQFGARADAYLNSAVHAQGVDLQALAALAREQPDARVLDLGCGGGHVTFHVAPHVREVVAYDLSPEMLDVVDRAAKERGLGNVTTKQGLAESLPVRYWKFRPGAQPLQRASLARFRGWPARGGARAQAGRHCRFRRYRLAGHAAARYVFSGDRIAARLLACAQLFAGRNGRRRSRARALRQATRPSIACISNSRPGSRESARRRFRWMPSERCSPPSRQALRAISRPKTMAASA